MDNLYKYIYSIIPEDKKHCQLEDVLRTDGSPVLSNINMTLDGVYIDAVDYLYSSMSKLERHEKKLPHLYGTSGTVKLTLHDYEMVLRAAKIQPSIIANSLQNIGDGAVEISTSLYNLDALFDALMSAANNDSKDKQLLTQCHKKIANYSRGFRSSAKEAIDTVLPPAPSAEVLDDAYMHFINQIPVDLRIRALKPEGESEAADDKLTVAPNLALIEQTVEALRQIPKQSLSMGDFMGTMAERVHLLKEAPQNFARSNTHNKRKHSYRAAHQLIDRTSRALRDLCEKYVAEVLEHSSSKEHRQELLKAVRPFVDHGYWAMDSETALYSHSLSMSLKPKQRESQNLLWF